ncbi:MAG: hypothetical protein AVDCRST_MAG40-543, partial [uncultured Gemmatimonadaceae bacterium]
SIVAVAVGFVLIAALAFGTDALLRAALPGSFDASGRITSTPLLLLTLAYVGVYAVAGCYTAAALAPGRPMRHALVLGALGLVFTALGTAAAWHSAPAWYHAVSLLLVLPYAWLGGRLRERARGRPRGGRRG